MQCNVGRSAASRRWGSEQRGGQNKDWCRSKPGAPSMRFGEGVQVTSPERARYNCTQAPCQSGPSSTTNKAPDREGASVVCESCGHSSASIDFVRLWNALGHNHRTTANEGVHREVRTSNKQTLLHHVRCSG